MIARIALGALALAAAYVVVREGAVQAANRSQWAAVFAMQQAPNDSEVLTMRAKARLLQAIGSQAQGAATLKTLFPADSAALREAGRLAQQALKGDITNTEALAIQGLAVAAQGGARAKAIMNASASLSKRNLTTQLWLVEDAGKRDNLTEMLTHIDTALRVSASAQAQLFPVLTSALRNTSIVQEFTDLLQKHPPWTEAFLYTAITSGVATTNLGDIYLKLNRMYEYQGQDLSALILEQLIAQRRFAKTFEIGRGITRDPALGTALIDPDFEKPSAPEPFTWVMTSSADFDAIRSVSVDGRGGIELLSTGTGAGVVARQLLNLPSGAYVFSGSGSSEEGERVVELEWRLRCAESSAIIGQGSPFDEKLERWVVPSDCRYQWLELYADADRSLSSLTLFIGGISLIPAP